MVYHRLHPGQGGHVVQHERQRGHRQPRRRASRATRSGVYDYIHPNDHINFGQSTNDVFPTAGRLTALALVEVLLGELSELQRFPVKKAKEFDGVIKMGRTHLQDAVPIRLGQEFHAYATMVGRDIKRIRVAFNDLKAVNMGATAVGTGLNADEKIQEDDRCRCSPRSAALRSAPPRTWLTARATAIRWRLLPAR